MFQGNVLFSISNVFRSTDVLLDCFSRNVSGCSNIVRGRPKTAFPKLQLQYRELKKYFSSTPSLDCFNNFGDRNRRGKAEKKVNMVRLYFLFNHIPSFLLANFFYRIRKKLGYRSNKDAFSIFRTPNQMVSRLIDKASTMFNFNHKPIVRFLLLLKQEVSCATGVL